MNTSIGYEIVSQIARLIARCDFRVTVSRYETGDGHPWIITVGESTWRRHLIVTETSVGICGPDAMLAVLDQSESDKFGYDIRTDRIEKEIRLTRLIAKSYVGVKRELFPSKKPARAIWTKIT